MPDQGGGRASVDVTGGHVRVLDGWRGISIALVLIAHWVPLGRPAWLLNVSCGVAGVGLFFVLSGFLITRLLFSDEQIAPFLVRRAMRVVPLAWAVCLLVLWWHGAGIGTVLRHLTFTANWFPIALTPHTEHLWSLCVEVQFYAAIALLIAILGRRGLVLLPFAALIFTVLRMQPHAARPDLYSFLRVDEILAGGTLALWVLRAPRGAARALSWLPWPVLAFAFLCSCDQHGGWIVAPRPYLGAALIGRTLFLDGASRLRGVLQHRALGYLADVSYALYVLHVPLTQTWLGSGSTWVRYAKRPLLMLTTGGLAHLSTFHFERHCIEAGRRWARRLSRAPGVRAGTLPEPVAPQVPRA